MTDINSGELFSEKKMAELFPADRADRFFDAFLGDPAEGAYDICLGFKQKAGNPLNALEAYFKTYRPRKIPGRKFCIRAGVAILVADRPFAGQPHVMMIRRAKRAGDPWSGNMGFPGGRGQGDDQSIFQTALRELREETGLADQNGLTPLGRLSELVTRAHEKWVPMIVTPFVFRLDRITLWRLSEEVDELVWIPLSFFMDRENRTTMTWGRRGVSMRMPCYFYGGRRIWGLSLLMLDELMSILAHLEGGTPVSRRLFASVRLRRVSGREAN